MKRETKNGIPVTMKGMSLKEKENKDKLNLIVPMDIPGRHQLMDHLRDLIIQVSDVTVKPITRIPNIIRGTKPFFSVDGYWNSTFMAYGVDLNNRPTVLWDDYAVDAIEHYESMVDTTFIKERLKFGEPMVLVVATKANSLEFYCYLP